MKKSYFVLIFFVFLLTRPYPSSADTTYAVKKGDNLSKIAKKFKIAPERIKEANDMESNRLMPGTTLTIPAQSSSKKKVSSSTNASSKPVSDKDQKDPHVQEVRYHTLMKGDSLASISKKYGVSVKELKELNNIKKSNRLKPGRQLIVKKIGPRTYTVKKGDNISKIAKRFHISPDEIMEFNDLETEDLKPGQTLLLEEWTEQAEGRNSSQIVSRAGIAEDIKTLSESPELESMDMKERVTLFARKMLNIPYRFGGSSFMGIDCSGYVQKVFGFLDMTLPRSAREQFHVGEPVTKEDLSMGDLVFFRTYASFPSHVGIYLGNDLFIHASSRGRKVTIDSLDTPYYFKRFIGGKRLLTNDFESEKEPNGGG